MKIKSIMSFLAVLLAGGCEMGSDKDLDFFNKKTNEILKDKEMAIVVASELTEFPWENLCFKRKDFLELSFHSGESKVVFRLDYGDYFVNEPYVEGSLANKCVSSTDRLLVKKRYAGSSKPVEFFKDK